MTEPGSYLQELQLRAASLAVFRGLLRNPVIDAFCALCACAGLARHEQVERYAVFAGLLLEAGGDWSAYLRDRVLRDENSYVRRRAAGREIPAALGQAVKDELATLQLLGCVTSEAVAAQIGCGFPLPRWETGPLDLAASYEQHMARVRELGYGVFADHHMFLLRDGEPEPVAHADPVDYSLLTGYERERELVAANTRALLAGRPAANVLLYGDSGTGKSTCVKAVANELRRAGLRLIELQRDQMDQIPLLIDRLSDNPLKFILFIDDLSFAHGSEHFSSLKAILEGSVASRAANTVIYATSNRRHLVRERFSERDGDDVHVRDTLEELGSLSERFGLTVTFLRPGRELYCAIAEQYCGAFGIPFDTEMSRRTEAFALERGGRSARSAKQFAERMASQIS